MGKRMVCLICAVVLALIIFPGLGAAEAWNAPDAALHLGSGLHLAKGLVRHSPNPLASAMFLILAGIGISMLFDKKNKG